MVIITTSISMLNMEYPVLAVLAETFLCISASSAPSERIWSQAGLVITYKRASMGEDLASGIIFVKENRDVLTFDKAL